MSTENILRITDAWASDDSVVLDFAGVSAGEERRAAQPDEFAVVATMMSQGKPVYFSRDLDAVSTDPFFGTQAPDPQEFTDPLKVVDMDLLWSFKNGSGKLVLTLKNRSIAHLEISNPSLLVGWVLTRRTHDVVFDGSTLKSQRNLGI